MAEEYVRHGRWRWSRGEETYRYCGGAWIYHVDSLSPEVEVTPSSLPDEIRSTFYGFQDSK